MPPPARWAARSSKQRCSRRSSGRITHRGVEPRLFFWRTTAGAEVDFVVETEGKRHSDRAVKLSATPRPAMGNGIRRFQRDLGSAAGPAVRGPTRGDVALPLGPGGDGAAVRPAVSPAGSRSANGLCGSLGGVPTGGRRSRPSRCRAGVGTGDPYRVCLAAWSCDWMSPGPPGTLRRATEAR